MSTFEELVNELREARLDAVTWRHGGRDLELSLTMPVGEHVRMCCNAVTGLEFDLEWRRNASGAPRAGGAEVERTLAGRWSLHWEFPPHGRIALECADLQVLRDAVAQPG
jgi:hypothetical protein